MKLEVITTVASAVFFLASMALALHLHHSQNRLKSAIPEKVQFRK